MLSVRVKYRKISLELNLHYNVLDLDKCILFFFNNLELLLYRVIFIYVFWKFSYISKLSTKKKQKRGGGFSCVCFIALC